MTLPLWNLRSLKATLKAGILLATIMLAMANLAMAQSDRVLEFKDAVGVTPFSGVAASGAINLNVVRGVNPAGPWRISKFDALVDSFGNIKVHGKGLLLAAGNGIGTNGNQSVHATLFCGPAATATAHSTSTAGVALEDDGDFVIDEALTPLPPVTCENPVLLIRNVGGLWFAAGIPKR